MKCIFCRQAMKLTGNFIVPPLRNGYHCESCDSMQYITKKGKIFEIEYWVHITKSKGYRVWFRPEYKELRIDRLVWANNWPTWTECFKFESNNFPESFIPSRVTETRIKLLSLFS